MQNLLAGFACGESAMDSRDRLGFPAKACDMAAITPGSTCLIALVRDTVLVSRDTKALSIWPLYKQGYQQASGKTPYMKGCATSL